MTADQGGQKYGNEKKWNDYCYFLQSFLLVQFLSGAKQIDYQIFLAPWPCSGTSTHNYNHLHHKFTLVWEGCWMSVSYQVFLLVQSNLVNTTF